MLIFEAHIIQLKTFIRSQKIGFDYLESNIIFHFIP